MYMYHAMTFVHIIDAIEVIKLVTNKLTTINYMNLNNQLIHACVPGHVGHKN